MGTEGPLFEAQAELPQLGHDHLLQRVNTADLTLDPQPDEARRTAFREAAAAAQVQAERAETGAGGAQPSFDVLGHHLVLFAEEGQGYVKATGVRQAHRVVEFPQAAADSFQTLDHRLRQLDGDEDSHARITGGTQSG